MFVGLTLGVNPFPNGHSVTLDQLAADTPGIQLPNSPLANASNVAAVWEDSPAGGFHVAIYYSGSGIEVLYGGGTGHGSLQAPGYVQTINGIPALALPAGIQSRFAEVEMPVSGHTLTLLSHGPLDDLIAVASQMVPTTSSG